MDDGDGGRPNGERGAFDAAGQVAAGQVAAGQVSAGPDAAGNVAAGQFPASPDGLDLAELRARIDVLDGEIVGLLNERAQLGLIAGEIKRRMGRSVPDPGREAEVLTRVTTANGGPFPDEALLTIYREIMRTIVELEERESEGSR